MNKQFFGKIEHWESIIGSHNVCRVTVKIESLKENYFELEGQRLEIMTKVMGDMRYNTMVWIPSIKTLYGSDVLFNQAHPFTCELTKEERAQWIADVDKIEKMGAEVIIPGHQKPGMQFDKSSLDFTREYIVATEEELVKTDSVGEFYYAMASRFPDANLTRLSNGMNAMVFQGRPGLELARNRITNSSLTDSVKKPRISEIRGFFIYYGAWLYCPSCVYSTILC